MTKVMIVGLGLIGASLAKCIKNQHPTYHLIGWDALASTRVAALEQQIVDEIPTDFASGASQANYIILAVPVKTSLNYLQELAQISLQSNILVSDVGSTKQEITDFATRFSFDFIGGHPMAGSHKSGIQAANDALFENAYYIFTPLANTKHRVSELIDLVKGTKAKQIILSAQEHDQITGMLSHFPHILAAALVNQADSFNQLHPNAKRLAAGGFRDITRIASSDPKMWTDILLSNQNFLIQLIDQWQVNMEQIKNWLLSANQSEIFHFFENAKDTRDRLPIHSNGAIPGFHDLFVDVPDKPGVIAEVTSLLGQENLSIINIKILETREDIIGVLQITFKTQNDLEKAKVCITEQTNYQCRMK